jgi:hypothetical protein
MELTACRFEPDQPDSSRHRRIENLRHRFGFAPYPFLRGVIKRTLEAADLAVHDLTHPAILSFPNIEAAAPS